MRKIIFVFEQQPVFKNKAWVPEMLHDSKFVIEYWSFIGWKNKHYIKNNDFIVESALYLLNNRGIFLTRG